MCRVVVVERTGEWLYNLGDLARVGCVIPEDVLAEAAEVDAAGALRLCFCCVDPEDVLEANGWSWRPLDFGDVLIPDV